ncbi:MAG: biotin--[acetyl-CoA-carboxylase] ligase [Gemmatimonadaceae bacterium]
MRDATERVGASRVGASYDGWSEAALAAELALPRVALFDATPSTMDAAHELAAAGAPAGTLVLADRQTAGRGRAGKGWSSPAGSGVWMTLVERPRDAAMLEVLSLRLGLRAAPVLERWAPAPVRLKWPNDLYVGGRKLAGVLVEARWREDRPEWVAVGVGVNVVAPPDVTTAAGLEPGTRRVELLAELVPALRAAAFSTGALGERELAAFAERDLARGRRARLPVPGVVRGIDARGALLVEGAGGVVEEVRGGSLVFEEEGT